MPTSISLKPSNTEHPQVDHLATPPGDILDPGLTFSFSNSVLDNDLDVSDHSIRDVLNDAIGLSDSASHNVNNEPKPPLSGDVIKDFGGSLNEPTSPLDDEIPIDDAPILIVPIAPEPIAPLPSSPSPNLQPPVDHIDETDLGAIEGPMPDPPVLTQTDPITGTPFDALIQQLLQSLNPPAPSAASTPAPSRQPSNATATIAEVEALPPRATAAASITASNSEMTDASCQGLSALDELTLRLHDGFELRSGNTGKSTAQLLTNYGNDSDDRTFIRVTDRRNPFATSYTAYFEGEVRFGETFTVRAEAGGSEAFHSKVYLHYFDEEDHNILRTVQYSASCDAPVRMNDELGGATLVGFSSLAD